MGADLNWRKGAIVESRDFAFCHQRHDLMEKVLMSRKASDESKCVIFQIFRMVVLSQPKATLFLLCF